MDYSTQDFRHHPRRDHRPLWFMGALATLVLAAVYGVLAERDARHRAEMAAAISTKHCPPPSGDGLETVWIVSKVTADGKVVGRPTCGRVTGSLRAAPKKKTVFAEAGK